MASLSPRGECNVTASSPPPIQDVAATLDEARHLLDAQPAPDRIDAWLDPHLTDKDAAQRLISGIEYAPLQVRAVSAAVNKTGRGASKGPELIEPLADHADQPLQLTPA
jgi:putative SOS response-associated peptidase YedK